MNDQNKNLILASVLSFVVIIVWFVLFPPPEPIQTEEQNIEQTQAQNLPAQEPSAVERAVNRESQRN